MIRGFGHLAWLHDRSCGGRPGLVLSYPSICCHILLNRHDRDALIEMRCLATDSPQFGGPVIPIGGKVAIGAWAKG